MCLYPKLMKNRRYLPSKKNGGIIPPLSDERKRYVPIGCGNCLECRKKKGMEWSVRLKEEMRDKSLKAYFMTWTLSDESIIELRNALMKKGCEYEGYKMDNEICTLSMRRFLERWRKKYGRSIKHWAVTELGQTKSERIHMHGIVWTNEDKEDLQKIWKYGIADIGKKGVGEASAGYLVKYMSKVDEKHKEFKSKVLSSPGIGGKYLKREDSKRHKFKGDETVEDYRTRTGIKLGLPMYYRQKLWTDDEREELWMKKLDEERRFVLGVEIDVSTKEGMEDYNKAVERARKKNKRYGFGDDKIDVERRVYEKRMRKIRYETMLIKKRIDEN